MIENYNKMYVSKVLKIYNRKYRRNFTVDDLALKCDTTRQTLVRLSGASKFDLVKRVILSIYSLYDVDLRFDGISYQDSLNEIAQILVYGIFD